MHKKHFVTKTILLAIILLAYGITAGAAPCHSLTTSDQKLTTIFLPQISQVYADGSLCQRIWFWTTMESRENHEG